MAFTRENYYGVNWFWYAADMDGNIGVFTSGYSPVPLVIFKDNSEEEYERLMAPMYKLRETEKSFLTDKKKKEQSQGVADYSEQLLDAKMGIYVFEGDDLGYELIAYPENSIKLSDLPLDTAEEISKVTFKSVRFSNVSEINVPDYFEV